MVTSLSNNSLRREIEYLRRDFNRLYHHATLQNSEVLYEWERTLLLWKNNRLEALEAFANAQFIISKMEECSAQFEFNTPTNGSSKKSRPRRKRKNKNSKPTSTGAVNHTNNTNLISIALNNENVVNNNKENQRPSNQDETASNQAQARDLKNIKAETNVYGNSENSVTRSMADTLRNMKVEKNENNAIDENNITQSMADNLKYMKVEKEFKNEQDEFSYEERNKQTDNVPQLVETLNLKVEVDVDNNRAVGASRKRKPIRYDECAKKTKNQ